MLQIIHLLNIIDTSYDSKSALGLSEFYDGGYLYKIEIDDSKGVNVNKVLGDHSLSYEKEFAVLKKIPNENIKGYVSIDDIDDINKVNWKCY